MARLSDFTNRSLSAFQVTEYLQGNLEGMTPEEIDGVARFIQEQAEEGSKIELEQVVRVDDLTFEQTQDLIREFEGKDNVIFVSEEYGFLTVEYELDFPRFDTVDEFISEFWAGFRDAYASGGSGSYFA